MKTLITVLFFALFQFAQSQELTAETMRWRFRNQDMTWTKWDTSKCNVPIEINPEYQLLTCHNALDQTFSILPVSDNEYASEDYEGIPLTITVNLCLDESYNVLFSYDYMGVAYQYEYLHCRKNERD